MPGLNKPAVIAARVTASLATTSFHQTWCREERKGGEFKARIRATRVPADSFPVNVCRLILFQTGGIPCP